MLQVDSVSVSVVVDNTTDMLSTRGTQRNHRSQPRNTAISCNALVIEMSAAIVVPPGCAVEGMAMLYPARTTQGIRRSLPSCQQHDARA